MTEPMPASSISKTAPTLSGRSPLLRKAYPRDPKPFRWTKTADDILASIQRFCLRTLGSKA
jgi:hypothetical protein